MVNGNPYPTPINLDSGVVPHGAEFIFVVTQQPEGTVVVASIIVIPSNRVDAGVGEVLNKKYFCLEKCLQCVRIVNRERTIEPGEPLHSRV